MRLNFYRQHRLAAFRYYRSKLVGMHAKLLNSVDLRNGLPEILDMKRSF